MSQKIIHRAFIWAVPICGDMDGDASPIDSKVTCPQCKELIALEIEAWAAQYGRGSM